ncbi:MAG TPA: hypothetical protein VGG74_16815 [Kofleriaceae bacterium]|jgi:hypothetical protein
MKTETETKQIEAVDLEQVTGGARGIVTPLDFWANYWGAVMSYAPPFSTTPLFPRPFG